MFVDIETDEATERGRGVERVQVKPLVLERSPPRFDQGVREGDLGLCEHTPEYAGVDEFLDGSRAVLDASVGEQRWWRLGSSGLKEDGECVRRIVRNLRDNFEGRLSRLMGELGFDSNEVAGRATVLGRIAYYRASLQR